MYDNVCATVWLDRKNVMFMSTGFDPTSMGQVVRRQKDGTQGTFPCPVAGVAYNKHMGGVDLRDQHCGYYHVRMKYRKVYKYIANFLFDVTITSSFILYNLAHPHNKMVSLNFREVLGKQLIGDYCTRKRAGQGSHVVRHSHFFIFPFVCQLTMDLSEEDVPSVRREKKGVIHTGIVKSVITLSPWI